MTSDKLPDHKSRGEARDDERDFPLRIDLQTEATGAGAVANVDVLVVHDGIIAGHETVKSKTGVRAIRGKL